MNEQVKEQYGRAFGLPAEQIRFFEELTPTQVKEVAYHFDAGLIDVDRYVYAVKRDGRLVWDRQRRRVDWELAGTAVQVAGRWSTA